MELISIIIPVFNVERYLVRCIKSVLNQTYSNLQIILVDDGSTDHSGEICDFFKKKDNRIQVIHKKNGGSSDARNAGIAVARGAYITFADSDDIMDHEYINFLYKLLINNDADISVCRYKRFVSEKDIKNIKKVEDTKLLNTHEAIEILLYSPELIPQAAWGKLYKIELFQGIKFPVGYVAEDIGTTYKLFYKSSKIVINSSQYYYYFQRKDGIVRSAFSVRSMDNINFSEEILEFVRNNIPQIEKAAICFAFAQNIQVLAKLPYKDKNYERYKVEIERNIKKYRWCVLTDKKVPYKKRLGALASFGNLAFIKRLAIYYKKYINKEPA